MDSMTRRTCLVAAAALLIVLLSGFSGTLQVGTVPIHFDAGAMVSRGIWVLLTIVGGGLLYLSKEALSTLKRLDGKVSSMDKKVETMTHEMFGPNGTNGMRGDMKHTKRLVERHDRLLVLLADRAHINFSAFEEDDK